MAEGMTLRDIGTISLMMSRLALDTAREQHENVVENDEPLDASDFQACSRLLDELLEASKRIEKAVTYMRRIARPHSYTGFGPGAGSVARRDGERAHPA